VQLAMVKWIDSSEPTPNAEVELEDVTEPQIILSIGFVLHECDEYVAIAGAIKPARSDKYRTTFDYCISIPKVAILEIAHLDTEDE
jgi:hypothetical protein